MTKAKIKMLGKRDVELVEVNIADHTVKIEDRTLAVSDLPLDIPISGTVYGTLLNYQGELEKLGDAVFNKPYQSPPVAPVLYLKPTNTLNRHGAGIPMPLGVTTLQVGAALGIVIGQQATSLNEANAMSYIAGYTIVNDVRVPHDHVFRPAVLHQARDGFCPIGPWIVETNEMANPDDLAIRVFINDRLVQECSTANCIRSVSRLLSDVTDFMTLRSGDVLLIGVPEDSPLVSVGDHIRIDIEGIGQLENHIVDESECTWRGTT